MLDPKQFRHIDVKPDAQKAAAILALSDMGMDIPTQERARAAQVLAEVAGLAVTPQPSGDWTAGEYVALGTLRTHAKKDYRCIQPHVTQSDWPPDKTPALWVLHTGGGEWAPGEEVARGDLRSYGGISYCCIQGHTTQAGWEPPNVPALWEVA